jgi:glycerol-3-phosphate dehydrogenase (NAD(P)+)
MKLAVAGAGAWGTALAVVLSARHEVALWGRDPGHIALLRRDRRNEKYLSGIALPPSIALHEDLAAALESAAAVLVVSPTNGFAATLAAIIEQRAGLPVIWACKGFETATQRLPHEIVQALLPDDVPRGALSGPSFALEVAQGKPAALTLASPDAAFASRLAAELNGPSLRIYSSGDVVGVELGGALKNVIAIAAGISDGLDLGYNARAALITRGLAEMVRLGVRMGGDPETFMGLTGLGDLVLTATGELSRNRTVGKRIAAGVPLAQILAGLGHVAEGVQSARAAQQLAQRYDVSMPITDAVCGVLFDHAAPIDTVRSLLARDPKPEQH